MGQPRVVMTRRPPGDIEALFDSVAELWAWPENRVIPPDTLLAKTEDADGLYCMLTDSVDRTLLDASPRLVAISQMAVGVDNIDLAACTERGIPVGHTPDVLTETTADLTMGLVIAAARRFRAGIDAVRSGDWGPWDPGWMLGHDIFGSTIGIIGLGRIGSAVAKRASAFGMKVLYTKRRRDVVAERRLGVDYRSFADLLAESDHVVVLTALTEETKHLIDRQALDLMKPTASLVNASRGPVVDTGALVEALRTGVIASAALDVTDPEPIPSDHPLVAMENCLIVPHIGSATVRTRIHMAELAAGNLLAALSGERMPHCANPEVY